MKVLGTYILNGVACNPKARTKFRMLCEFITRVSQFSWKARKNVGNSYLSCVWLSSLWASQLKEHELNQCLRSRLLTAISAAGGCHLTLQLWQKSIWKFIPRLNFKNVYIYIFTHHCLISVTNLTTILREIIKWSGNIT